MQTESTTSNLFNSGNRRLGRADGQEVLLQFPISRNESYDIAGTPFVTTTCSSPLKKSRATDTRLRKPPKRFSSFDEGLPKQKSASERGVVNRSLNRSVSERSLGECTESEQARRLSDWTRLVKEVIGNSTCEPCRSSGEKEDKLSNHEPDRSDCWASVDEACAAVADDLIADGIDQFHSSFDNGENNISDIQELLNNLESNFSASCSTFKSSNDDSLSSIFSEFSGLSNTFHNSMKSIDTIISHVEEKEEEPEGARAVSFESVTVRYYERVLSDNPASSCGPSVGIGWRYGDEKTMSVDDWEEQESDRFNALGGFRSSIGSFDTIERRPRLRLSPKKRQMLLLRAGYTHQEIEEMVRVINIVKEERRQTVESLRAQHHPLVQVVETSRKTLKRMLFLNSPKRRASIDLTV